MIAVGLNGFAQENHEFKSVWGISPLRLWDGLRIKYERVLTPQVTYGGMLTGYYGRSGYFGSTTPGVKLAPVARFYFKGTAPEGFYAQGKIAGGIFQKNATHYPGHGEAPAVDEKEQTFTSFGGGLAGGYQLLWGKDNRWSIDVNIGVKYMSDMPHRTFGDADHRFIDHTRLDWYIYGPGSIIDGLVSIGYRL